MNMMYTMKGNYEVSAIESAPWVVVVEWDNCGSSVHGIFSDEDTAQRYADHLVLKMDEWDRRHNTGVTPRQVGYPSAGEWEVAPEGKMVVDGDLVPTP